MTWTLFQSCDLLRKTYIKFSSLPSFYFLGSGKSENQINKLKKTAHDHTYDKTLSQVRLAKPGLEILH